MFNGSTTASQKTICIAESGLGRSLLFFTQHRAPTAPAAAEARMLALGSFGMLLSYLQIVIVGKLLPRRDIASRLNENSMMLLLDLAIRCAGMIDPARRVSLAGRVDDQSVIDGEKHGVRRMRLDSAIATIRLRIRDQRTFVFDDARSLWNPPQSKNAPTVDRRIAHGNATPGRCLHNYSQTISDGSITARDPSC